MSAPKLEAQFFFDGLDGIARLVDETLEVDLDENDGDGIQTKARGRWRNGAIETLVDSEWGQELYRDECGRLFAAIESSLRVALASANRTHGVLEPTVVDIEWLERTVVRFAVKLERANIECDRLRAENENFRQLLQAAVLLLPEVAGTESICESIAAFGGAGFATDDDDSPTDRECNQSNATHGSCSKR
jgi:hypothetical protein